MTANEAVNELRRRACATGVAGWTWNYDVEHGTISFDKDQAQIVFTADTIYGEIEVEEAI